MKNKQLYWKLYQAKRREAKALEEKKKEQIKIFPTFLKLNVDFGKKK